MGEIVRQNEYGYICRNSTEFNIRGLELTTSFANSNGTDRHSKLYEILDFLYTNQIYFFTRLEFVSITVNLLGIFSGELHLITDMELQSESLVLVNKLYSFFRKNNHIFNIQKPLESINMCQTDNY